MNVQTHRPELVSRAARCGWYRCVGCLELRPGGDLFWPPWRFEVMAYRAGHLVRSGPHSADTPTCRHHTVERKP